MTDNHHQAATLHEWAAGWIETNIIVTGVCPIHGPYERRDGFLGCWQCEAAVMHARVGAIPEPPSAIAAMSREINRLEGRLHAANTAIAVLRDENAALHLRLHELEDEIVRRVNPGAKLEAKGFPANALQFGSVAPQ